MDKRAVQPCIDAVADTLRTLVILAAMALPRACLAGNLGLTHA